MFTKTLTNNHESLYYTINMNINLPYDIIADSFNELLLESPTFRKFVIDNYLLKENQNTEEDILEIYRQKIKRFYPSFKDKDKVAAIKWFREETRDNNNLLDILEKHGYFRYSNSDNVLSLTDAKRFIESVN